MDYENSLPVDGGDDYQADLPVVEETPPPLPKKRSAPPQQTKSPIPNRLAPQSQKEKSRSSRASAK